MRRLERCKTAASTLSGTNARIPSEPQPDERFARFSTKWGMTGSDSERLSLESHVVPASALHDLVPFPASGVFVTHRVLFPDVTHVYCPAFSLQPLRPVCTGPYRRFAGDTRPVTEFVPDSKLCALPLPAGRRPPSFYKIANFFHRCRCSAPFGHSDPKSETHHSHNHGGISREN